MKIISEVWVAFPWGLSHFLKLSRVCWIRPPEERSLQIYAWRDIRCGQNLLWGVLEGFRSIFVTTLVPTGCPKPPKRQDIATHY